ncbi:MAG: hypothetical protein ACM3ZC_14925 [Bacteroidota bacterium]
MTVLMVGSDECRKCRQAKAVLNKRGLWPEIEYVEAGSARGRKLGAEHGLEVLPFYILDGKAYAYTGEVMRILEERREAGP